MKTYFFWIIYNQICELPLLHCTFNLLSLFIFFFLIMTEAKELFCIYSVQWTGSCSHSAITYFAVSVCQNLQFEMQMILNLILSPFLSSAIGISFLYWNNVVFKKDGFKNCAYFSVFSMERGKGLPEASSTAAGRAVASSVLDHFNQDCSKSLCLRRCRRLLAWPWRCTQMLSL